MPSKTTCPSFRDRTKPTTSTKRSSKTSKNDNHDKQTPKGWPSDIQYLHRNLYSPSLSQSAIAALTTPPADVTPTTPLIIYQPLPSPSPLVRIQPIPHSIPIPSTTTGSTAAHHPAAGQHGLFAARHLPPSSLILTYTGLVHPDSTSTSSSTTDLGPLHLHAAADTPAEPDPHAVSDYDLSLDRFLAVAVDAAACGNEARFINDYRGVAPGPNAEFAEVWVRVDAGSGGAGGGKAGWERRMGVFVLGAGKSGKGKGGIGKGQEVLVSYGKGFWRERGLAGAAQDVC